MSELVRRFRIGRGESGQTLAEYGLILSLIAVIAIAALILLGTDISNILSTVGTLL
jgi:Flp pilus assembly pilin Flp